MKPSVLEMTVEQLRVAATQAGLPAYRADQLADWVWRKGVTDPAKMANLPASVVEAFEIATTCPVGRADSRDGTLKLLLATRDGQHIETVMIPEPPRATACLSTQIGCGIGCGFCASGQDGLVRNLSAGEIVEQVLHLQQAAERRITNVVLMGMGEPLANYDAVLSAIRTIVDPKRLAVSARKVTVSTVGLPKAIRRLAREAPPVTLAISLHAPTDAIRRRLIPAAAKTPLADVLAAASDFYGAHKREVTLEYVLLAGVNDSMLCADALAQLARPLRCNVNLIRYNPVASLGYQAPSAAKVKAFASQLRSKGVNVHVRRSRGADADAACGQLRRRMAPSPGQPDGAQTER